MKTKIQTGLKNFKPKKNLNHNTYKYHDSRTAFNPGIAHSQYPVICLQLPEFTSLFLHYLHFESMVGFEKQLL